MSVFKKDIAYQELINKLSDLKSLTKAENEATTRLRIINTILFDILNWDKTQIETEKYCRQEGYADYVFHINNNPYLVLEAKKTGTSYRIRCYIGSTLRSNIKWTSMDFLTYLCSKSTTSKNSINW